MTDIIPIFLLIGVANWASHILHCEKCTKLVYGLAGFFVEGLWFVLGWPLVLLTYIKEWTTKTPREDTVSETTLSGTDITMIQMEQKPGESMESFVIRARDILIQKQKNECQCGHQKGQHIYEEGACRPGGVACGCEKFNSRRVE